MDDTELVCGECGLRYQVTWHNDGHEPPDEYGPRCGSDDITEQ